MVGDYVRDKDAVTASMIIAEMGAYYFDRGMTLLDAVNELYEKYGYFREVTLNLFMYGVDGVGAMKALMEQLRKEPPTEAGGIRVARVRDYRSGDIVVPGIGAVEKTAIVGSNVLYFDLDDGSALVVRPSGTEPKIKMYVLARDETAAGAEAKRDRIAAFARGLAEAK
jgi:phosphoglucomutase